MVPLRCPKVLKVDPKAPNIYLRGTKMCEGEMEKARANNCQREIVLSVRIADVELLLSGS